MISELENIVNPVADPIFKAVVGEENIKTAKVAASIILVVGGLLIIANEVM